MEKLPLKTYQILFSSLIGMLLFIVTTLLATEPVVEAGKTISGKTVINSEMLEDIPIKRNFQDVLKLVPGVSTINNQVGINGGAGSNNLYMIDGVEVNNPYMSAGFMYLNFDAIEEVQVQTSGFGAEYGRSTGGIINVITKSGGNELSGTASLFYTPNGFSSNAPEGVGTESRKWVDDYLEPSFTLGGPILKDKLWFFTSMNVRSQTTQPKYENDEPVTNLDLNSYFKFNYLLDDYNRFSLAYNFTRIRTDWDQIYSGVKSSEINIRPQHLLTGTWNRKFSNDWRLDLTAFYSQFNYDREESERPVETSPDWNYFYEFNKLKSAKTFGVEFDLIPRPCFCGPRKHQLKIGGGFRFNSLTKEAESVDTQSWYYSDGDFQETNIWQYKTITDQKINFSNWSLYLQDEWSLSDRATLNLGIRLDFAELGWPKQTSGEFETKQETAFTWSDISPRVSFMYDIKGDGKNVISTYFGRYYQPLQYNWFQEANPMSSWGYNRNHIIVNDTTFSDEMTTWSSHPKSMIGYDDYDLKRPYMDELSVGIEREMWEDWSLGLRYIKRWERDMIQTVDASRVDMDALLDDGELVWLDYEDADIIDPYNDNTLMVYKDLLPDRMSEYYIVNPPGAKRDYDGIELTLNKRYSQGWSINASYVYGNTRGLISPWSRRENYGLSNLYQNPNNHINADGRFMYSYPHQFKAYGTVDIPYGIKVGASTYFMSGNPYTRKLTATQPPLDAIPDGFGNIYAEPRGDSQLPSFWMLNLGLQKTLKINDKIDATFFLDGYNILNNDTEIKVNPVSNNLSIEMGEVERILNPGLFQFGVRVSF